MFAGMLNLFYFLSGEERLAAEARMQRQGDSEVVRPGQSGFAFYLP
jgi:hypothetical protein